jgi:hypothetical protein
MMGFRGIVVKDILWEERLSEPSQECRPVFHNRVCINPHDDFDCAKAACRHRYLFDVMRPQIECHITISTQAGVELATSAWLLRIEREKNGTWWNAAGKEITRERG